MTSKTYIEASTGDIWIQVGIANDKCPKVNLIDTYDTYLMKQKGDAMSLQIMRTEAGVIKKRDETWEEIQKHLALLFVGSTIEYIYRNDDKTDTKYCLVWDGARHYNKLCIKVSKYNPTTKVYDDVTPGEMRLGDDVLPEQFCAAVMDAYKRRLKGAIIIVATPHLKTTMVR
jgi:hypothetical protein